MSTPCLDVQGLNVRLGGQQVVDALDLRISQGETLALAGESGCGKSTTALALMGLLPRGASVDGRVLLNGNNLLEFTEPEFRRVRGRQLSMIFQEPMSSLNPLMTVGDQIAEAVQTHMRLDRSACRRRVLELLDQVRIDNANRRVDEYPHQLSGGQRQRIMIAMAIACGPQLLIADEPTTALDATIQSEILNLLDELRRGLSMSMLLITHDLSVVGQWADRVAVMRHGRKLEEGITRQVFQRPREAYTQSLLAASLALHPRDIDIKSAAPADTQQAPLLDVRSISVRHGNERAKRDALSNVSLHVHAGETVGLVGESGSGKSTLSRALMQLIHPHTGRILMRGQDVTQVRGESLRALRREVQMVFQDPYGSLNPRHTVDEILSAVLAANGVKTRAEQQRKVSRILDRVGLAQTSARRYVHEFSGGQRQRLAIAKALMPEPRLLICDEPVSALDVSIQAQILELLRELQHSMGLAMLFISHDLAVVRHVSQRVYVLCQGRIVEEGSSGLWANPQHPYTARLIAAQPQPQWATEKAPLVTS